MVKIVHRHHAVICEAATRLNDAAVLRPIVDRCRTRVHDVIIVVQKQNRIWYKSSSYINKIRRCVPPPFVIIIYLTKPNRYHLRLPSYFLKLFHTVTQTTFTSDQLIYIFNYVLINISDRRLNIENRKLFFFCDFVLS